MSMAIIHLVRTQNFPKNLHFLPPDTHTARVSLLIKLTDKCNYINYVVYDHIYKAEPELLGTKIFFYYCKK